MKLYAVFSFLAVLAEGAAPTSDRNAISRVGKTAFDLPVVNKKQLVIDAFHKYHDQQKLLKAACAGDSTEVDRLIELGVDVNFKGNPTLITTAIPELETTPLLCAAGSRAPGTLETVKSLIKAEADVNAVDSEEKTALHYAARDYFSANAEVVKALLEEEPDVNAVDNEGKTALHYAARNYYNSEMVKALLKAKFDVNAIDKEGKTALHYAAGLRYYQITDAEVVKALLEKGVDRNAVDEEGKTALHYAARYDSKGETVKALLEDAVDEEGKTIAKPDVNAVDKEGKTALHYAAKDNDRNVVEALVKKGANVNACAGYGCLRPLHFAAKNFFKGGEVATALLEKGADVNAVDYIFRKTALDYAVQSQNEPVVEAIHVFLRNELVNGQTIKCNNGALYRYENGNRHWYYKKEIACRFDPNNCESARQVDCEALKIPEWYPWLPPWFKCEEDGKLYWYDKEKRERRPSDKNDPSALIISCEGAVIKEGAEMTDPVTPTVSKEGTPEL